MAQRSHGAMLARGTALNSVFVGVVAAGAVWASLLAQLPVWAVFLGWALYFVLCANVRAALLTGRSSSLG